MLTKSPKAIFHCVEIFWFLSLSDSLGALTIWAEKESNTANQVRLFRVPSFMVFIRSSNHRLYWPCHHQLFCSPIQVSDIGGQVGYRANFSSGALQVHNFDLFGSELGWHLGGKMAAFSYTWTLDD